MTTFSSNPIIAEAERALARQQKSTAEYAAAERTAQDEIIAQTPLIQEQVQRIGASQAIIDKQKRIAEYQMENNQLQIYEIAGGHDALADKIARYTAETAKLEEASAEVTEIYDREITGIAIVDDLLNSISATRAESEVRARLNQVQVLGQGINNFAANVEHVRQVESKTQQTMNTATIVEEQKIAEEAQALSSNKSRLDAIRQNATSLKAVMEADGKQTEVHLKQAQMFDNEENRKYRTEQQKLSIKSLEFQVAQYQDAKTSREEKIRIENQLVDSAVQGLAIAGLPEEEPDFIKAMLREPGKMGDKYRILMEIGRSGSLGATPADAAKNLNTIDPAGVHETALSKQLDVLKAELGNQITTGKPAGISNKEWEARLMEKYNILANTIYTKYASKIAEGDQSNPYQAPPFSVLATHSRAVKESALYKNVLEPVGMVETVPTKIMELTVASMRKGQLTPEQAALGIQTIFSNAANYNNSTKMFDRGGLPMQKGYVADIKAPGKLSPSNLSFLGKAAVAVGGGASTFIPAASDRLFGTNLFSHTTTVDLTNYNQVQQLLARLLSSAMAENVGPDTGAGE